MSGHSLIPPRFRAFPNPLTKLQLIITLIFSTPLAKSTFVTYIP
nr:MAG TPA: hypothetical protein [Caudoviricetes sp.]